MKSSRIKRKQTPKVPLSPYSCLREKTKQYKKNIKIRDPKGG